MTRSTLTLVALLSFPLTVASAQSGSPKGIAFFEKKIRPVLVKHCYACHSQETGKAKGGLRLDSRTAMLRGGERGPAIVRRAAAKSLLIKAIGYRDDGLQMPPKGKLPAAVIADFRKWIEMGAPDPRTSAKHLTVQKKIDLVAGRRFWAYQQPVKPNSPKVKNNAWPRSAIDRHVLAKLESKGLTPVKDADARTLVRRLYFALIGLPPSPQEMKTWTTRIGPKLDQNQIAKLVDHLLQSPRYGERWGRHWMDVARYAESTGGDHNNIYPHAWRYRDYVIDAFNNDKPYDRFILEQLAGDLMPARDDKQWGEQLVATGFLAIGVKLVGEENQQRFFADVVDEQIDTTTRAFLATTVACARCHDHKFDPIPQTDYYALAGIFRSTQTHFGLVKAQARQATTLLDVTGLGLPAARNKLDLLDLLKLYKERDDARQRMTDYMTKIRGGNNVPRGLLRRARTLRDKAEAAVQFYDKNGNPRLFAMGVQDKEFPLTTRLLVRGEVDRRGAVVDRGTPHVFSNTAGLIRLSAKTRGSGRLQLARWIASPKNPLTARVMANRVWHYLFGQGIVRTTDDFGKTGEYPSHPELLDYLAVRLVELKWSIKSLIREIVLSRTWQLSSSFSKASFAVDPENRLLWRMNQRRLDAEALRDAMLTASGNIKLKRPVGTLLAGVGEGSVGLSVFEPEIRKIRSNHRSVYLPRVRNVLPESLALFDAPDASLVTGSREETSTPLQSLYLLNNPFVIQQAEAMAAWLAKLPRKQRVAAAYQIAFGRQPTEAEVRAADRFAEAFRKAIGMKGQANVESRMLAAYCQALLTTAEFRTVD